MKSRWSKKETQIVIKTYSSSRTRSIKKQLMEALPARTWEAIKLKAHTFGLKSKPCGNISKLLEETPEAYYWVGFIMADGYIDKNERKLVVNLSDYDKQHLLKLSKFLNCTNPLFCKNGHAILSLMDVHNIPLLCKKFNFRPRKTYNPPNLNWLIGDKFLAFLAGYIDGDGCLSFHNKTNNVVLEIKGHQSWKKVFELFVTKISILLSENFSDLGSNIGNVSYDSRGYVRLRIGRFEYLKFLKSKILLLHLPLLRRKWNRINLKKISKWERASNLQNKSLELFKKGISIVEIAKIYNKPYERIRHLIRKKRTPHRVS